MTTLADAILETSRLMGVVRRGKATGGSATTCVDTARYEKDDYYNGGTLMMLSGDSEGKTRRITDFVQSTGTITTDTFTTVNAAGDIYAVTLMNREFVVQAINMALADMGPYTKTDDSLVVVNNYTEYTLPSGVSNVRRIEVAKSASVPYDYVKLGSWKEINGKIYLPEELDYTAGRTIRLYYNESHDDVEDDTDVINDLYNRKRLACTAAYLGLAQRQMYTGNEDAKEQGILTYLLSQSRRLAMAYPVPKLERDTNKASY